MVFVISPLQLWPLLDVSALQLLLGKKQTNPAAWRRFAEIMNGKRRLTRRSKEQFSKLLAERCPEQEEQFWVNLEELKDGPLWEAACLSFEATSGAAFPTLRRESVRLEHLSRMAAADIVNGNIENVIAAIRAWDLATLPSVRSVLDHLDANMPPERVAVSVVPLIVTTTLYLMACWGVDETARSGPHSSELFVPCRREGLIVRPMTRWVEGVQKAFKLPVGWALYDRLLARRSFNQDPADLRRLARKWRQGVEIPACSRVPHILDSLGEVDGVSVKEHGAYAIYRSLAVVRLLDKLLTLAVMLQEKQLSWLDPVAAFDDYPLLVARATKVAAPPPQ